MQEWQILKNNEDERKDKMASKRMEAVASVGRNNQLSYSVRNVFKAVTSDTPPAKMEPNPELQLIEHGK